MSGPARCDRCADFIEDHQEAVVLHAACYSETDTLDGEALRLLREALPEGSVLAANSRLDGSWCVSVEDLDGQGVGCIEGTIAAAANACRAALEGRS